MIYSVDFKKLTEKINPLSFVKYLKDTGWMQFPTKKTYVKIFQISKSDSDFFQVTIPMNRDLLDYQDASIKLQKLSHLGGSINGAIVIIFAYPNTDILKIRLDRKNIEAGSILFDDAIRVYENAKKLIAATAQDVLHPKKYHQGRIDDAVSQFINN